MNLGALALRIPWLRRRDSSTAAVLLPETALPWQQALEGLQVGVAVWDLNTGIGDCSAVWARIFGLPPSGAHFEHWLGLLRRPDAEKLRSRLDNLRPTPPDAAEAPTRPSDFSLELRVAGRGQPWLSLRAQVLQRDALGQPTRLMTTCSDASAQHAAGDRQRVSAQLFAHLHEGLVITDLQHRVLEANPAYCEITGVPRAELVGQVPGWLQPSGAGGAANPHLQALHDGLRQHGRWQGEVVERRRNGDP